MNMGMPLFLVERPCPLKMLSLDAVFLGYGTDMILYVALPCLLVGEQQFSRHILIKGNHAAVHGDMLLGILIHQPCNVTPVLKFGEGTVRGQLAEQSVAHSLVFGNPRTGGNVTYMGVVLAGRTFVIRVFESLFVD